MAVAGMRTILGRGLLVVQRPRSARRAQGLLTYTAVGVDGGGVVDAADVEAALTPDTVLVSIMHSNTEVRRAGG